MRYKLQSLGLKHISPHNKRTKRKYYHHHHEHWLGGSMTRSKIIGSSSPQSFHSCVLSPDSCVFSLQLSFHEFYSQASYRPHFLFHNFYSRVSYQSTFLSFGPILPTYPVLHAFSNQKSLHSQRCSISISQIQINTIFFYIDILQNSLFMLIFSRISKSIFQNLYCQE